MRIFLLNENKIDRKEYVLSEKEKNYLFSVLRLSPDTVFKAKDGKENYYDASFSSSSTLTLTKSDDMSCLLDNLSSYKGRFVDIDLFIGSLKGRKNESVIRMAQEAGVRSITFLQTAFCENKKMTEHEKERLFLIKKEAVQQSGARSALLFFSSFNDAVKSAEGKKIILHQGIRTKSCNLFSILSEDDSLISLFIGPEGGFSDSECLLAEENGFCPVLLNTNILRSETAAIYALGAIETYLNK